MITKKNLILTAAVLAVTGAGLFTAKTAFAEGSTPTQGTSIVQRIAEKFGLQQADVQAVFDQDRADRQAQMQAKAEERLTQLVTDGKITDAQKQLILAKQKELQAGREAEMAAMKDKTPAERKAAMEQHRADLEAWAKTNGIDAKYLMGGFGFGHRGGPRMDHDFDGDGPNDSGASTTPAASTAPTTAQ